MFYMVAFWFVEELEVVCLCLCLVMKKHGELVWVVWFGQREFKGRPLVVLF